MSLWSNVPRSLLLILILVTATQAANAQTRDNRGTEFWVAFMANNGSGDADETSQMELYISCEHPTNVAITYHRNGRTVRVPIPQADRSVVVDISAMFGTNVELASAAADSVSRKTLKVVADDEISLYGSNVRIKSADAFMSLPTDVLGGSYIVLAYPNGYINVGWDRGDDMPSEFAVIATKNGTTVTIQSPAAINGRPANQAFSVRLDSGQAYFAQASLDGGQDVSGTTISADKPVALYSGAKRVSIPRTVGNNRDHLVEQLPPLQTWGKEALLTPHFAIAPGARYNAVARVIAANDSTTWTLDGVRQPMLSARKPVEIPLTQAQHIVASGPILVAQYEHSSNPESQLLGDPFMMLIPPPEQFDSIYSFQCVANDEFMAHYANVVIPSNATSSLRIDGATVPATFRTISGTRFSYAQIPLAAGAHFARADSTFGLYVYGYGVANSYGYPGGMLLKDLTQPPPAVDSLRWADNCGNQLIFQSGGMARRNNMMAPFPNPNPGTSATLYVGLSSDQIITVVVSDPFGNVRLRPFDNLPMRGGVGQLQLRLDELPQGEYFVQLRTSSGDVLTQKLLIAR